MFDIDFSPPAEKYFKKLKDKNLKEKYHNAIKEIREKPYIVGELKTGDLAGIYCYDVYHNGTNYEIAYRVYTHNEQLVIVILAGTRENFYKALKKYIK